MAYVANKGLLIRHFYIITYLLNKKLQNKKFCIPLRPLI